MTLDEIMDEAPPLYTYSVNRNETFIIPEDDKLTTDHLFIMIGASLVPKNDDKFYFAVVPKKAFVPTFDKEKEKHTLILQWASRVPAEEARVKITAEIDLAKREIKVKGSGFHYAVIHVYNPHKDLA